MSNSGMPVKIEVMVAFRRDDSIAEAGKCQFLRRNDASDEFEDFLA